MTRLRTVGVVATTVAAAVESGAVAGLLVLGLVVALLFLSGPLGMSVLARAAFLDPETPRSPNTRELIPSTTEVAAAAGSPLTGTSPLLAVFLFGVWVALFGSLEPNVVIGGGAVAIGVAFIFRHLAPRWPRALAHPIAALRFMAYFISQLAVSTWDVVMALRLSPEQLQPAVIDVPLRVRNRTETTLLMNSISFTPGTVALELHDRQLFVHVLDTDDPDAVVATIQAMEGYIMGMFGSTTR